MNRFKKPIGFGLGLMVISLVFVSGLMPDGSVYASNPFVTTWKTNQVNPNDATVTIPVAPSFSYNYYIDWGDGNSDSGVNSTIEHTYSVPGTYQISISGTFPRMLFKDTNDRLKIQSVDAWGSIEWQTMVDAFSGCENLRIKATDKPDLSRVNSLSGMFRNAKSMNDPIGHWELGSVSGIVGMFDGATSFNQNLNEWDTSKLQMFAYAFRKAASFNSPLNNWDMSSAVTTNGMFADATSFNQPLDNWDLGRVNDLSSMFHNALSFNQDISMWNVGSVQRMESTFRNAVQFQQDLSTWNFSSLKYADFLLSGGRLNSQQYDRLLISLAQSELQQNVRLDAGVSTFCDAAEARSILINQKRWNISDGGKDAQGCGTADIRFTSGVAGVVLENTAPNNEIGTFITINSNNTPPFTYSFCNTQTEDSKFFNIINDRLILAESLNYEEPGDQNKDNVYTLCVVSTSARGFTLQKLLTVAVLDVDETPTTAPPGEVLSTTTSTDIPAAVLAETDTSGGEVLAASGAAIIAGLIIGLAIVLSPLFSFWKAPKEPKNSSSGFSKFN